MFNYSISLFCVISVVFVASCNKSGLTAATKVPAVVTETTSQQSVSNPAIWPESFGLGRMATKEEIALLDIDVRPDGKGLPAGSGNASDGKKIYAAKCAVCHGKTGTEGPTNRLVGNLETKEKTIGNYWPYSTTVFDYIRRAMPFNVPGSLTDQEVYSLTAFLLQANRIIDSTAVMDAHTLPKVVMPAQKYFVEDDRRGGPEIR